MFCRLCGNSEFIKVLSTKIPLAANVTNEPQIEMTRHNMNVVCCTNWLHVQLKEVIDSSFYSEYLYTPSYASDFSKYISELSLELSGVYAGCTMPKVIEIGSSNGYLLSQLKANGWDVLGIEPSEKLAADANSNGIHTICEFFSKETAPLIKNCFADPDVMIFRHVMEHLDNLDDIVEGIADLLSDGLLLIEVPYLKNIIEEKQFYAFFHEHLSYFSVGALDRLLRKKGIIIQHVDENTLEGGSILIWASKEKKSFLQNNLKKYLALEKEIITIEAIKSFSDEIENCIQSISTMIENAKANKKKISAWGAGQRGCTLVSMCNLNSDDISYVIDVNRNYWGKYVPGTDIPIVPPDYYNDNFTDEIIIFATGYADSIINENEAYTAKGGIFRRLIN